MQSGILRSGLINEMMRLKLLALRMLDHLGSLVAMVWIMVGGYRRRLGFFDLSYYSICIARPGLR